MAADPNWFYSTLAQSSAAIVGLTGGFFVQRLLVQRTEALEQRADVRGEVEHLYEEVSQFRNELRRVIIGARKVAYELRAGEKAGSKSIALDPHAHLVLMTDNSILETRGTSYPIETSNASEFEAMAKRLESGLSALPQSFEDYVSNLAAHKGLPPEGLWGERPRRRRRSRVPENLAAWLPLQTHVARSRWLGLRSKAEPIATRYERFKAQIIPRSFFALVTILFLFLIIGVIAPLFFLSPTEETSKTLMLMAFIPLCFAFTIYVGYELRRLRAIGDLAKSEIPS